MRSARGVFREGSSRWKPAPNPRKHGPSLPGDPGGSPQKFLDHLVLLPTSCCWGPCNKASTNWMKKVWGSRWWDQQMLVSSTCFWTSVRPCLGKPSLRPDLNPSVCNKPYWASSLSPPYTVHATCAPKLLKEPTIMTFKNNHAAPCFKKKKEKVAQRGLVSCPRSHSKLVSREE